MKSTTQLWECTSAIVYRAAGGKQVAALSLAALLIGWGSSAPAQTTSYPPKDSQIPAPLCLEKSPQVPGYLPCTAEQVDAWRNDIFHWRDETRLRMGYDDSEYRRPELKWSQSSFMQPQMMVEDRYFYDPVRGKYTVDRYLNDMDKRIGGIDSVLVWHSYPNIGVDDRSQYDLIRDLPGGLAGVREMVAEFHKRGVRVLFPIMLWDQGTQTQGVSDQESIAGILAEVDADGVNGDTLSGVSRAFRVASDKTAHPLVFEPEMYPGSNEMLAYNNMSWGYWHYPFTPLVSEAKLIESRHMVNVSDRWNRSKTDNLQFAFFNGVGFEAWENVWSIWNGFTPRGAETIRRVASVERAVAPFLVSPDWEPLTPTLQFGVFASRWTSASEQVFTIINRNEYNLTGPQLELPYARGMHYYDLWNGTELIPQQHGSFVSLSFPVEGRGFAAVLATPALNKKAVEALLKKSKRWSDVPLDSLSDEWRPLPQAMVAIRATPSPKRVPKDMIKIPSADFLFRIDGLEFEGENEAGVDVQYPWEDSPRRHHLHQLRIGGFWIDKYPVTNAEYKRFLDATQYRPTDSHNFLKDWKDGTYPAGWEAKPVTWISEDDARAYAAWAGKRLPHEWEWQYAAQGSDRRVYPWGNLWDDKAVPVPDKTRALTSPDGVDAHPGGASPFGVMDMVGNVWQWTDEFQDEHTRAAVVRGGSYYQPQGSRWYFPKAYKNTEHGKYLLMAPSRDRAGTIGFRCVMDAAENQ